jgi:hypothetical protein
MGAKRLARHRARLASADRLRCAWPELAPLIWGAELPSPLGYRSTS